MTKQPHPEEFKIEAVKQITERCHRVGPQAGLGGTQAGLHGRGWGGSGQGIHGFAFDSTSRLF